MEKLDKPVAKRILTFLKTRLAPSDDPRALGSPLKGARLGQLWRYRVGDYHVICNIQDKTCLILVIRVAKREIVYR